MTTADIKDRGRALGMVTSPDKLNSVVRRILGNSKTDSAFFEGQKAAVKISVEHQVAEREIPTTTTTTTTTTPTPAVTELVNVEEVTLTTIIIHYNGSLDNATTTSLLNGSDVTSGVTVTLFPNDTVTLSPNATVYNNETTYNETTQSTTSYHQPMEGIGVDAQVTNVSTITVNVPLSGLVDAVDIIDKKMVFTVNEDDLINDEDLPWCDE